ncbi:MAG: hypothetical protein UIH27_16265, partial [Ruminococcus sp.]|nr:hypothetical protein [Ruminococcus sp.]
PQPAPKKNKMIVWWVLGWIFIFPIPLTIIISRNKKLKTGAKIGIIAAAWIVWLLMGLAGKAIQDNEQIHSDSPQTSYSEQTTGNIV